LATQKRENHSKDDRVSQGRRNARLTGAEHTTRTGREGQEKTGAEREEERRGHDEIGLGEHETHRLGDEAVHQEEHECVEEDGHLAGFAVRELDVLARGGHEHTGAEREKKGSRNGDFLGRDIGKHLIYTQIIFYILHEMVIGSTSHHFFMETILVYDPPDMSPNIMDHLFTWGTNTLMVWVMFSVTKFNKITELS
jgi:hypothetical protein